MTIDSRELVTVTNMAFASYIMYRKHSPTHMGMLAREVFWRFDLSPDEYAGLKLDWQIAPERMFMETHYTNKKLVIGMKRDALIQQRKSNAN